jgi:Domain of unknown function (DUF4259)
MGTWGVGGFENDQASDWSYEFDGVDLETGLKLIRDALNFDAAFAEGDPDCADVLAVASAELVIRINGYSVPEAPDTHHLDEIDDDDEPLSLDEIVAQTEAETRSLGMAIAEEIGRPGEVLIFEPAVPYRGRQRAEEKRGGHDG